MKKINKCVDCGKPATFPKSILEKWGEKMPTLYESKRCYKCVVDAFIELFAEADNA